MSSRWHQFTCDYVARTSNYLKAIISHIFPHFSTIYVASTKNWLYFESGAGFNAIEAWNIEKFDTNENPSTFTHHN